MSDIDKIKDFIKLLEESGLKKLQIKKGDFEVMLEKADEYDNTSSFQKCLPSKQKIETQENIDDTARYITSPMVGTFYLSSSPDQPSFVKNGDYVTEDTVICIIEAMKVMNEVKAGMSGKIIEILEDNAKPVEFGTKLFRIE